MIYRSATYTPAAGGNQPVDMAFLPDRGPMGGPNVVEYMTIELTATVTNPVGVTVTSRDLASLIRSIRLKDAGGLDRFRGIDGLLLNKIAMMALGAGAPALPAAAGAGAATVCALRVKIPMTPFGSQTDDGGPLVPEDFHIYTGDLRRTPAELVIGVAAVADLLSTGGASTSITAISLTVECECYEYRPLLADGEKEAKIFSRWVWEALPWESLNSTYIPCGGRPILGVLVVPLPAASREATGLQTVVADYSIDQLGISNIPPASFVDAYRAERDRLSANDYTTVVGSDLPLLTPGKRGVNELPAAAGNLRIRCTPGALAFAQQSICCYVEPKHAGMAARAVLAEGITTPGSSEGAGGMAGRKWRSRLPFAVEKAKG